MPARPITYRLAMAQDLLVIALVPVARRARRRFERSGRPLDDQSTVGFRRPRAYGSTHARQSP
ncbi:MAG: hypothetical protein Q7T55_13090 [Solirubrobacteraceae bacterium]|nr:hypothetical protein [Solirubrobacteraceae bacterium]